VIEKSVIKNLIKLCGKESVLYGEKDLFLYEYDASAEVGRPEVIVLPQNTEQVVNIVRLALREKIPYVPRGSATNLSGGSVAVKGGLVICFSRMNRILEIDIDNECAIVEPGVYNLTLQEALAPHGYFYAPDPASQKVSTLAGNVAENAGGPHCLKYGVTTNHVLGLEVVTPDGQIVQFGNRTTDTIGYDLVGIMNGSEGTLCIATKIIVRIMRQPEGVETLLAVFDSIDDAARTVSDIIAQGIVPATLELLDNQTIRVVEASLNTGYPLDAEAVLLIEVDGPKAGLNEQVKSITELCSKNGSRDVNTAQNDTERDRLWTGRRGAVGAMTRLRPSIILVDGTVPRTCLPNTIKEVGNICNKYNLQYGILCHAGDGNLHPTIVFDNRDKEEVQRANKACQEILTYCVDVGGTITGEHGIGTEKMSAMSLLFSQEDMDAMLKLKRAFDPQNLCNPDKIFPSRIK
jgi:glycolate oxidase